MRKEVIDQLDELNLFLDEIGETKKDLDDLLTYKALDYRFRDIKQKKMVKSDQQYEDRALRVITEYFVRKYDYTSNWIE